MGFLVLRLDILYQGTNLQISGTVFDFLITKVSQVRHHLRNFSGIIIVMRQR